MVAWVCEWSIVECLTGEYWAADIKAMEQTVKCAIGESRIHSAVMSLSGNSLGQFLVGSFLSFLFPSCISVSWGPLWPCGWCPPECWQWSTHLTKGPHAMCQVIKQAAIRANMAANMAALCLSMCPRHRQPQTTAGILYLGRPQKVACNVRCSSGAHSLHLFYIANQGHSHLVGLYWWIVWESACQKLCCGFPIDIGSESGIDSYSILTQIIAEILHWMGWSALVVRRFYQRFIPQNAVVIHSKKLCKSELDCCYSESNFAFCIVFIYLCIQCPDCK